MNLLEQQVRQEMREHVSIQQTGETCLILTHTPSPLPHFPQLGRGDTKACRECHGSICMESPAQRERQANR
jgi:hypothetical protein